MTALIQANLKANLHVFRFDVVQSFLSSGTPLSRLPFFHLLFEQSDICCGDVSDMASLYISLVDREM